MTGRDDLGRWAVGRPQESTSPHPPRVVSALRINENELEV